MRLCQAFIFVFCLAFSGTAAWSQSEGAAGTNQVQLRFKESAIYKQSTAVSPASMLLKKKISKNADGSGSLAAVLLLTNRTGFDCQADPDMPLASERDFIVGISLYETFAENEGPEKTLLHQMLFSASASEASPVVTLRWQGETAVLVRFGPGKTPWHSLQTGRTENGLTISEEKGRTVLTLDYGDTTAHLKGRVLPTRCP